MQTQFNSFAFLLIAIGCDIYNLIILWFSIDFIWNCSVLNVYVCQGREYERARINRLNVTF